MEFLPLIPHPSLTNPCLLSLLLPWSSRHPSNRVLTGKFSGSGSPSGFTFARTGRTIQRAISGQTDTGAATALRPFYFVVHPDLFGRFPEQRVSEFLP